jgi:hypothetical protein
MSSTPHQITKKCRVHLTKSRRHVEYTSPNYEDMSSSPHQITKKCRVHLTKSRRHVEYTSPNHEDMSSTPHQITNTYRSNNKIKNRKYNVSKIQHRLKQLITLTNKACNSPSIFCSYCAVGYFIRSRKNR